MAQLVERVLGKDEVGGSNPPSSSKKGHSLECPFLHSIREPPTSYIIIADEVGLTLAGSLCCRLIYLLVIDYNIII